MSNDTTVPPGGSRTDDHDAGPGVLCAVIIFSADAPERAGEVARFPDLGIEHILGRGALDRGEVPVEFERWRPDTPRKPRDIAVKTMPRRLLQIIPRALGLDVKNLSDFPMRISGQPDTQRLVLPGQTILVGDRLLLYVTRRSPELTLQHFPASLLGPFGQPDAFGIIGESEAMMRLRDEIARAARSGLHVLVRGESGAGKEAVARALHRLSSRAKGPFISHNGAGLSETLAQAEIFGNEKNFPNPPMEAHAGLVGEAHGGVLYLDEIGELPREVQAMLLRVLDQGGQYRRLGESRNRTSDFLMVGATNSSLEGARRDFVARFLATILVPALREHAEDIPLLAQPLAMMLLASNADQAARFIEERPDGSRYVRISPDLLEALMLAEHPLNVRGLAAYLWRAMGTSKGSWIRPSRELIEELRRPSPAGPGGFLTPEGRMRELTADEQQALRRRIDGSAGCVARAAAAMGVSRHQLRRALKRYGIVEPRGGDDDR